MAGTISLLHHIGTKIVCFCTEAKNSVALCKKNIIIGRLEPMSFSEKRNFQYFFYKHFTKLVYIRKKKIDFVISHILSLMYL